MCACDELNMKGGKNEAIFTGGKEQEEGSRTIMCSMT